MRPRGALTNAGWNVFATTCNIAISFLLAPLLIHHLGTAQYGLLLLVWSIAGVLSITNLGVGEATLRYVSHYHADGDMRGVNRVFGSTLSFYIIICITVSVVLFPTVPVLVTLVNMPADAHHLAGWLLRLSAVLFSLEMISNAFRSIPMALQRYDISSKVGFGQGLVRTVGFIVLVLSGFGVLHLVLWDVLIAFATLCLQVGIGRALLPGIRVLPRVSLSGFREIFGYGVYSFLTHIFLAVYRESGKLILGNQVGPSSVAYLGTPDNIAYRIYMVVISGIETLMPRFSANRDPKMAKDLVMKATYAALTASAVLFIPLAVLMPDFLKLWIGPEFARESATVGQLLAMSFIAPAGFAPIATFFRGTGRPGFVTIVMGLAGITVLFSSVLLVPTHGPLGVSYGYLLSSVPWLAGLLYGWFTLVGARSLTPLLRAAGVPLLSAAVVFVLQTAIRGQLAEISWPGLLVLGTAFAGSTCVLVTAVDLMLGGDSLSRRVLGRISTIGAVRRRIQLWQAR